MTTAQTQTAAHQYRAATEAAALYDNSAAGRLRADGADALDLLNRLSTNGILRLPPGRGAPTILTTDRGRILDLLAVVNTGNYVLLLTSPGQQQAVIDWLDKYTIMEDLEVADLTPATALFTICGPESAQALEEVLDAAQPAAGPDALEPYSALAATVAGQPVTVIRRPLGELPAFDLLTEADGAPAVWQRLAEAGLTALSPEVWEAAQVRYGVPRYGRELGDAYNPLEAGLIGSVDFAKGCYIGQEVIARLDTYKKVQKYLVQLRFSPEAQVAEGAGLELEGRSVGKVTSLADLPGGGRLGLAYVRAARAQAGTLLTLSPPAAGHAEIIALPQLFGPGE